MNIALRKDVTVADYIAWADAQAEQGRTELYSGRIIPMAPERAIHNRIKRKTQRVFETVVDTAGLQCEVFADGMTVPIDRYTAYGPDIVVNCEAPIPDAHLIVPNPIIVVEVTSPSMAHTDTSAKLIGYFKVASVRHYLIIDPDARTVTHHAREDGQISARTLAAGTLRLDPPGLTLDVAALFG